MSRTVLITGATSGIGRAAASLFAADGDDVWITGRSEDTVDAAAQELGVRGIACDGTDPQQVERLAGQLDGTLDVLVNNAGGLLPPGPAKDGEGNRLSPLQRVRAEWIGYLEKNLLSAVLTTTALRDRLATPGGAVINVSTIAAEDGSGAYGPVKAGLSSWSVGLSTALGPSGVTVNTVSPGFIDNTSFFGSSMTEERYERLVAKTHNKRAGAPEDLASTIHFLASSGARHITGQTIHVNGGAVTTR